jgi:hypothetical protein
MKTPERSHIPQSVDRFEKRDPELQRELLQQSHNLFFDNY